MTFFAPDALDGFSTGVLESAGKRALNITFSGHATGNVVPTPAERKSMAPANDRQSGILGYNR